MSKTAIDPTRHALNGATMGTRWSALFHAGPGFDPGPVGAALQAAVDTVDAQMSTWKPDSDLMAINRAPVGQWLSAPAGLMQVLATGLEIGRLSDGAFDIGMGDSVSAWGFGPHQADPQVIRAALGTARRPTHQVLELDADALRLCKHAQVTLDLCGIAKGYGVDRLMAVLARFGIGDALVGIDGEMRANGLRPDGRPWAVAVERPDHDKRAPLAVLELTDCAVATSGDYRHWVDVGDRRLSHTMDPARGGPLSVSPASVTVLAETCMQADAWATALMVQGTRDGAASARRLNLNALFIDRAEDGFQQTPVGPLFDAWAGPAADT